MRLLSNTSSRFHANKSLHLLLNTARLAEKQQIQIIYKNVVVYKVALTQDLQNLRRAH